MSAARWETIQRLFAAALERPPEHRESYLADSAPDAALRDEVLSLLRAHEARGRLDSIMEQLASVHPTTTSQQIDALRSRLGAALGDRYRIERELGHGGMAIVFLAEDLKHHRRVALKVLRPELASSIGPVRFMQEIAIAAALTHPHILALHDSGEADGLLFYVMPYVEGETLRDRLNRETNLPVEEALRVVRDMADALSHAHRAGVVHRDIKPENILFEAGHAVLSDFGIARAVDVAGVDPITAPGLAVGTPAYMSPEQAIGNRALDGRSDIYSLGCVAYEMLGGEPPFTGPSPQTVVARHVLEPVPRLATLRPTISAGVQRVIEKALAKVPADRYATATEFRSALKQLLSGEHLVAEAGGPGTTSRRRSTLLTYGGVGLAVVIGSAIALSRAFHRTPPSGSTPDPNRIAVFPFHVTGSDTILAEGLAELLAVEFTGEGVARSVDAGTVWRAWHGAGGAPSQPRTADDAVRVARGLGAGRLVLGNVVGTGNRLTVSATILDVTNGAIVAHAEPVSDVPDSLPRLLRRFTTSLLAQETRREDTGARDPGTDSPEALRSYIAGQAAVRHGQYVEARGFFERAVESDSTFTRASLAAVMTARWTGGSGPETPRFRRLAWAQRDRLNSRDRTMLVISLGPDYPAPTPTAERVAIAERAADQFPDNVDMWENLADQYFHDGLQLGYPDAAQRSAAAFNRALALDSTFSSALFHLFDLASARGDQAELRRLGEAYLASSPTAVYATGVRWRMAVAFRDWGAVEREMQRLERAGVYDALSVMMGELWDSVGMAHADRLLTAMARNATTESDREFATRMGVYVNLNRGRPRAAHEVGPWFGGGPRKPFGFEILEWLYGDGDSALAAEDARVYAPIADARQASDPDERQRQYRATCVVEQWRVWGGEHATVARSIERLAAAATPRDSARTVAEARTCGVALQALAAVRSHAPDAEVAVARFDSVIRSGPVHRTIGLTDPAMLDWELLLLARLYELRGDVPRALAATRRRALWETYPASFFLSASLRQEGRLAVAAGDREGAIRAYRWYLTLLRDPEPTLIPRRDSVRLTLSRLEIGSR